MSQLIEYRQIEDKINTRLGFLLKPMPVIPTLFTLINGTDAVVDDLWSYQIVNKFKNSWYAATAPSDPQAGMIWIDSDDDIPRRYDGAAWAALVVGTGESFHPFLLFGG